MKRSAGNSEMSLELQEEVCIGHEDLGVVKEPIKALANPGDTGSGPQLGEALMASECLGSRDGAQGC